MSEKLLATSDTQITNADEAFRRASAENPIREQIIEKSKARHDASFPEYRGGDGVSYSRDHTKQIEILDKEIKELKIKAEKAGETVIATVEQADQFIKEIINNLQTEGTQLSGTIEFYEDKASEHQEPRPDSVGLIAHMDRPDNAYIFATVSTIPAIERLNQPRYDYTTINLEIPEQKVDGSILHLRRKSTKPFEKFGVSRQESSDGEIRFSMNGDGNIPSEEMTPEDEKEAQYRFIDLAEKLRQMTDKEK